MEVDFHERRRGRYLHVLIDAVGEREAERGKSSRVAPPGTRQRITNTGDADLVFLAVCTPRFIRTVYQDLESEGWPEQGHDAQL